MKHDVKNDVKNDVKKDVKNDVKRGEWRASVGISSRCPLTSPSDRRLDPVSRFAPAG